jgi:hypothetical protein
LRVFESNSLVSVQLGRQTRLWSGREGRRGSLSLFRNGGCVIKFDLSYLGVIGSKKVIQAHRTHIYYQCTTPGGCRGPCAASLAVAQGEKVNSPARSLRCSNVWVGVSQVACPRPCQLPAAVSAVNHLGAGHSRVVAGSGGLREGRSARTPARAVGGVHWLVAGGESHLWPLTHVLSWGRVRGALGLSCAPGGCLCVAVVLWVG